MSQIKLIPTPSWLVYFVLKAQPFFINFAVFYFFITIYSKQIVELQV